jgi:predicted ATP-dependent Lon-type protease
MGSHLVTRDRKAVKKTVSGLMKITHPNGEATQEEIAELLEFAMEGRRRVKEQLKKMGSFEYYHTSFSYTKNDTGEERFVGVPEQGGRNMISADRHGQTLRRHPLSGIIEARSETTSKSVYRLGSEQTGPPPIAGVDKFAARLTSAFEQAAFNPLKNFEMFCCVNRSAGKISVL